MTETASTAGRVRPIPEGYHSLTPSLVVNDAAAAIDFYTRAFGARELGRMASPDGKTIWHAELQIGDSRLMLSDEFPQMGALSPKSLGGNASSIMMYVEDADASFQRAVAAGAEVTMPLEDAFWGDRFGTVRDPFGYEWGILMHQEDVSEEEMYRRAQAMPAPPA